MTATNDRLAAVLDVTSDFVATSDLEGRILDAVAYAAGRFLTVPSWREAIDDVLARLGEAAAVSRVYLFRNHRSPAGELLTSQQAEWAAPGIPSQLDEPFLRDVPLDGTTFLRRRPALEAGRACIEHASELPAEDRAWFERQGNRSVVLMPIFAGTEWWGHIGFDECVVDRVCSPPRGSSPSPRGRKRPRTSWTGWAGRRASAASTCSGTGAIPRVGSR